MAYRTKGQGTSFNTERPLPPKIRAAIETVGGLDDRRKKYLGKSNWQYLFRLAKQYAHLGQYGMPMTAAMVRAEARELRDGRKKRVSKGLFGDEKE